MCYWRGCAQWISWWKMFSVVLFSLITAVSQSKSSSFEVSFNGDLSYWVHLTWRKDPFWLCWWTMEDTACYCNEVLVLLPRLCRSPEPLSILVISVDYVLSEKWHIKCSIVSPGHVVDQRNELAHFSSIIIVVMLGGVGFNESLSPTIDTWIDR